MDISESFEQQQQSQQQPSDQQQQQQMQCEYNFGTTPVDSTGQVMGPQLPSQTAIPLPAPPRTQLQVPPPADIDIDSSLLQQFSCLGTTDHEDLINQFQSLMNNQMNRDSAKFFLEMSNWNLQTAVGCYLDFCNFQTIPSMKIVEQSRPSEFEQAWRLQNDGSEDWPKGCYLISPSQTNRIEIQQAIKPGDTCDILAEVPVSQPAVMWRLCTPNGWYFGDTIWMIPPGTCNTQTDLAERMSQLKTTGGGNPENSPQVKIVISVNME